MHLYELVAFLQNPRKIVFVYCHAKISCCANLCLCVWW